MMEQKICKNKKCQKPLPANYKFWFCESCSNALAKKVVNGGKAVLGIAAVVGTVLAAQSKDKSE